MRKILSFLFCLILLQTAQLTAANVGLLIVATGKYVHFVDPLIRSAERYFCTNHNVTYFVFTDQEFQGTRNTVTVYQQRMGWPFDTMNRYHVYLKNEALFEGQDYLFACDADMLFVDRVGDEILSERTATMHPGFIGKRGSYETNRDSKACVRKREGEYYFAGGFYGGSRSEFLNICRTNAHNIDIDLSHGIVAVWHDESHWNRYCIDHKPVVILSPSYCYPESWNLNYPKKLLALDKNHNELRK